MMEVEGTLLIWSRSASSSQLYGSAGKVDTSRRLLRRASLSHGAFTMRSRRMQHDEHAEGGLEKGGECVSPRAEWG